MMDIVLGLQRFLLTEGGVQVTGLVLAVLLVVGGLALVRLLWGPTLALVLRERHAVLSVLSPRQHTK